MECKIINKQTNILILNLVFKNVVFLQLN